MATDLDTKQPSAEMLEDIEKPSAHQEGYVEGNALLVDKHGNVRKVPVPSSNPNDPLNFKTWEKWAVILTCCWFCTSPATSIRKATQLTISQPS